MWIPVSWDEKWRLHVFWRLCTLTPQGSNCLSFSCRLFLLCILFNQSYFNCISILQRQYLLDLPSDYNTIHVQADPNGYSFYMQSISETAFNSKSYINSSRLHILQTFNLHMPAFAQVRSIFNINTLCWLLIIYHNNRPKRKPFTL